MKVTVGAAGALAIAIAGQAACRPSLVATPPDLNRTIVGVDSEAFEFVVRMELTGNGNNYPFKLTGLRVDARPESTHPSSGFPSAAGMSAGVLVPRDSALAQFRLRNVIATRRVILKKLGVPEGGYLPYPKCAGTLAPPAGPGLPPVRGECPSESHSYVLIENPVRGVASELDALNQARGAKPIDTTGEVWSVVVEERMAGPGGQMWQRHAWVLGRNPASGKLRLLDTILLAIAE
jgi:hypothetical protein